MLDPAPARRRYAAAGKSSRQKLPAMAQAFGVDAVADAGRQMPFDGDAKRGKTLHCLEQSCRRDQIVAVAVNKQHRRARFYLGGKGFGFAVGRQHQKAGVADDRRRRHRAAQTDMQRHHGALAETDQSERRSRQPMAAKLGVEKPLQLRRGLVDADPAFVRIAEGQCEPLPADRSLPARLGRMRRHECRLRQQLLPGAADLDEIVAVGTIAVQEHHKLPRRAGARRQPWPVKTWPIKTWPIKTWPIKTWPIKTWPIKTWPIKTWPIKTWPIKTWPIKTWPIKTWPIKTWPIKVWSVAFGGHRHLVAVKLSRRPARRHGL